MRERFFEPGAFAAFREGFTAEMTLQRCEHMARATQLAHESPDRLVHGGGHEVELHWSRLPPGNSRFFACRFIAGFEMSTEGPIVRGSRRASIPVIPVSSDEWIGRRRNFAAIYKDG